ncbi:glycosyltransferase family 2 protein [Qipengyuania huizhouensis]|uniref:glycosyltransferase family 2 protein n=1 Tax=Qipengyuania huizhouensis TaxID=2867245 RepID=UPI0018379BA9|nr:glycosyltransferase family 2 protein [Qipengyuania huizhouensis]MBA4764362.1 glycosyltransferase family 2 protein [Erythrobacter sp.]MBX7461530.1 glycosyltransferase family 2 protein [Qipengyuania huizhouensis]
MTTLSLIIPVFNEDDAIRPFLDRMAQLRSQFEVELGSPAKLEFIFVNDGSLDNTRSTLEHLCRNQAEIKVINLSRNFGKEAALSAGMHHASGDAVIPIDVDLQDPPQIIVEMIRRWKQGAQVVNAKRVDRSSDGLFKRGTANLFYSILEKIADQPVHAHVGDFRLLDRQAVEALNQLNENTRFNKGLFSWIGFKVAEVEVVRPPRENGTTKWKPTKLWSLALDGVTSSSTLPLRIWTYLGASIAFLAFLYAGALIVYTLITGGDMPGYASIMVAVLFLGGLNLLSLGLIGEYLGRIALEVRRRPLYIIESKEGF